MTGVSLQITNQKHNWLQPRDVLNPFFFQMWPPEDKEPLDMMDAREREEQYRVSVEWLYDMEDYNEWMHEEDYEVTLALTFPLDET